MRTKMLILVVMLFCSSRAFAQEISPLMNECGEKKCNGNFSVQNNGLQPLVVTINPVSFTPTPTGGINRTLDPGVGLELSSTSARIPPRGKWTFSYRVHCTTVPCSVRFYTEMSAGHTKDGLQVGMALPHLLYVCQKAKNCRLNTLKAAGVVPVSAK